MTAYYNEIDPYCVQWLRNLIDAKLIAPGTVDDRPIEDVRPVDLVGFTQCHFFAGLGGWSYALRLADIPDHRPLWTGSCPCQPFSTAGQRRGFADERHLWPFWHHLITQRRPPIIFGEQVARATVWLDLVRADLEGLDYAFAAAILPACSVGAEHQRDRIWFVADADCKTKSLCAEYAEVAAPSGFTADTYEPRLSGRREIGTNSSHANGFGSRDRLSYDVARLVSRDHWVNKPVVGRGIHGIPCRADQVCALGNAIVPQVAAEFIRAAIGA